MTTIEAVLQEPTPASIWQSVAGITIGDELLDWPPDLFALTDVVLERSAAYRFALSPPAGAQWPPARIPDWPDAVLDTARRWSVWVETGNGAVPELLAHEWETFREATELPLTHLNEALDWRLCEAVLTLHAIADEACAGLGVALDASHAEGIVYRARGRELLSRTGSLARIPSHLTRVLPKVRTPPNGTSVRSISRYASVHRNGVEVRWHKLPGRRAGPQQPFDKGVNYLLLPWPLRIRQSDFRPLDGSVHRHGHEPFGFFEFAPPNGLDLDLVDRVLVAARDEVDRVNVVVLPESAVAEDEIDDLEALLGRHGVHGLITGVRGHPEQPGQFPGNWVHVALLTGDHWLHVRQSKHHRWSLDEEQIYQYHLGGVLHPHIRWWEAMEVPRQSLHLIEVGEGGTFAALVCEDLAQIDDVADVIRSVGPTIVITPLLDGPQLRSRWAARYASVLADDPGSAVLTLTSFGMVQRCRPNGHNWSPVVALWKDPGRGTREIPLEPDAHGVLLSASTDRATRRSSDGRRPVKNGNELFNISVFQVHAASASSGPAESRTSSPSPPVLDVDELTVLTCWAEAVADALALAPERVAALSSDAHTGAPWRARLRIPEPSLQLDQAIDCIFSAARTATADNAEPPLDACIHEIRDNPPGGPGLDTLARELLRSTLEQRKARQAGGRNPTMTSIVGHATTDPTQNPPSIAPQSRSRT